jgi:hypothetical protein
MVAPRRPNRIPTRRPPRTTKAWPGPAAPNGTSGAPLPPLLGADRGPGGIGTVRAGAKTELGANPASVDRVGGVAPLRSVVRLRRLSSALAEPRSDPLDAGRPLGGTAVHEGGMKISSRSARRCSREGIKCTPGIRLNRLRNRPRNSILWLEGRWSRLGPVNGTGSRLGPVSHRLLSASIHR